MDLEVWFLGTGGSIPSPGRGLPSIAIRRRGELLIFDIGEGTQKQIIKLGLGFPSKMRIFITHLHGDHIFGLPGLLQTLSMLHREHPLQVYGPRGTREFLDPLLATGLVKATFPVLLREVVGGEVLDFGEYEIRTALGKHSVANIAYALVEKPRPGKFYPEKARELGVPEGPLWSKLQRGESVEVGGRVVHPQQVLGPPRRGRKVVYSGDTAKCSSVVELARGADLLIHEATFSKSLTERAERDLHSTSVWAAEVAKEAGAKLLALVHISPRYADPKVLEQEAREIFSNTFIPNDGDCIAIPLPD